MRIPFDSKWPLAQTLACACLAGVLFLGSRGLYQTTEGRYAECARQTMATGHWLDPVLNGQPHWTKPPLTYLAIMGPMAAAGVNTWTARAYLLPCLLLAIAGVWLLGRHLCQDPRVANLSALVFATSVFPLATCTVISTDFPLATLLILAQALFWRAVRTASRVSVFAMWVVLGLAFFTKGPPSLLVLPAMVVTGWLLPRERRQSVRLFNPVALILYLVIASAWYVWEVSRNPGLLHYWLHDEVINRSASDQFGRNPQFYMNFAIYLPVLLFGCWPWGGWLLFLKRKAWGAWLADCVGRGAGRARVSLSGWAAAARRASPEKRWSVLAFALPVLVFCLSRSKLPLYVLPLFGPLSVFIALGLTRAFAGDTDRLWKGATVFACISWTLFVGGKAALPYFPGDRDMKALHAAALGQVKDFDADRLAVFGHKTLNGLQFYVRREIPHIDSGEEIQAWIKVAAGQEGYMILRQSQTNKLARCAAPARVAFAPLLDNWMLARVSVSP